MRYFLAKTEPQYYSAARFRKERHTTWDGIRNPQALKALRDMRKGDGVLIYHSGGESAIVGLATVAGEPRPDPSNPELTVDDLEYAGDIVPTVSLRQIKETGKFSDFALVRQSRLSTMAVPQAFVDWLWREAKLVPTS